MEKPNSFQTAKEYWSQRLNNFELETYFDEEKVEAISENNSTLNPDIRYANQDAFTLLDSVAKTDKAKYIILLSTLGVLMQKISCKEDVVLLTPSFLDDKIKNTLSNTIPVRIPNTSEKTFRELLDSLTVHLKEDFSHTNFFTDKLWTENANISKVGMFIKGLQNEDFNQVICPDIQFIFSIDNTLLLEIKSDAKKYNKDYLQNIVKWYFILLEKLLKNGNKEIANVELITEAEKEIIVNEFNRTALNYESNSNLISIFEKQVTSFSNELAVVCGANELTYQDLNTRANQLGRYLQSQGLTKGDKVGLLLGRSTDMIVGILGVLKSGGVYLPISPDQPNSRIEHMLGDNVNTLLTQEKYLDKSSGFSCKVIDINNEELSQENTSNLSLSIDPNDLAYCIFTSGSTGTPKGVLMAHRSVANLVFGLKEKVYKNYSDSGLRIGLLASYVFDASVQQIFGSLLQGHVLYVANEEERSSGSGLISFYEKNEIEISDGTPTHFRLVLSEMDSGVTLSNLKVWILAGEELPKKNVTSFYSKLQGEITLFNMYGPTEACVDSTYYKIDRETLDMYTSIPIGSPLPNERIYITDARGNLMPIGVTGEVCVAGDGLAQGYLGDESLTRNKFKTDWIESEDRIYRTGDLARWLPNGQIEFRGRKDSQIKLRGYRIELLEVESVMLDYLEVKEVIIDFRKYKEEFCLVAYYVTNDQILTTELVEYLTNRLPDYMVPSYFVKLEKLPLTTNGKLDKSQLPNPEIELGEIHLTPSNAIEEKLLEIWSEVLKLEKEKISVNAKFIELGGHSLMAIQLANNMKKFFEIPIALVDLFEYVTIEEQASFIEAQIWLKEKPEIKNNLDSKIEIEI